MKRKKKIRIFQTKKKENSLIYLLKMAEHGLKEKDGFLRKLLMMRRNIFFPITIFFVYCTRGIPIS